MYLGLLVQLLVSGFSGIRNQCVFSASFVVLGAVFIQDKG